MINESFFITCPLIRRLTMDKYTKILFNELIFNNFEKIFNKHLISLIIYVSMKTWNTWFDPIMRHPRNMEHSS